MTGFELLEDALTKIEEDITHLSSENVINEEDEKECEDEIKGIIWERLQRNNKWELYTNFTENQILQLYRCMVPHIHSNRRRGPLPKISYIDGIIIILTFYKTGLEFDKLAEFIGIKPTMLKNTIERLRLILYETLHEIWLANPTRPNPINGTNFPHIALLVDSTSIQVYRPKAPFQEAKIYWDGKNHIYALKKEVAVIASKPHYCLFLQKGVVGSRHDYEYLKTTYHSYIPYLQKTSEEFLLLQVDQMHQNWSALFDKGYIGPENDTPGLRRIIPKKNPSAYSHQAENIEKNKIRVPVECFFGRLQKLWKVFRGIYRWDHKNFDVDFDNCAMLTNEHIKCNNLEELDRRFMQQVFQKRKIEEEKKIEKRKREQEKYKEKKKMKLANLLK